MVLLYLFGQKKNKEKKRKEKIRGQFCENRRTKWTGFIRGQTGFIRCRTGFIRGRTGFISRVDEASPTADEASPPTDEASPMGPYIFFLHICLFLRCVLFVSSWSFTIRISVKKTLFLGTYVDLLNYPFKAP